MDDKPKAGPTPMEKLISAFLDLHRGAMKEPLERLVEDAVRASGGIAAGAMDKAKKKAEKEAAELRAELAKAEGKIEDLQAEVTAGEEAREEMFTKEQKDEEVGNAEASFKDDVLADVRRLARWGLEAGANSFDVMPHIAPELADMVRRVDLGRLTPADRQAVVDAVGSLAEDQADLQDLGEALDDPDNADPIPWEQAKADLGLTKTDPRAAAMEGFD